MPLPTLLLTGTMLLGSGSGHQDSITSGFFLSDHETGGPKYSNPSQSVMTTIASSKTFY